MVNRPATAQEYRRLQTPGEEIANSVSHGLAALAALAAAPVLITGAARSGDGLLVVGVSVFSASMLMLYLASTLYHALPHGPAKRVFRVLEHSAIFVLIAGTYTPFTLGVLRGPVGWTLLGLVWGLAVAGVLLKTFYRHRFPILSTTLYVLLGWIVVVAIGPLVARVPMEGLLWLVAGGLAYTLGVAFYAADAWVRYGHFVWHLFVMAGTACHVVAVHRYAGG